MRFIKCQCQDSNGKVCHRLMTLEEYQRDGMCHRCAGHVWLEMKHDGNYHWEHEVN